MHTSQETAFRHFLFGIQDQYPTELSLRQSFKIRLQNAASLLLFKLVIMNVYRYYGAFTSPAHLKDIFFQDVPVNFTI